MAPKETELQELEQAIYESAMASAKVDVLQARLQYGSKTQKGGFTVTHKWCADEAGVDIGVIRRAIETKKLKAKRREPASGKTTSNIWDIEISHWLEYRRREGI